MVSLIKTICLLPNSILFGSCGIFLGAFFGSLGLEVDGESHFFFKGAYRGAINYGRLGWNLPDILLDFAFNNLREIGQNVLRANQPMLEYPNRTQLVINATSTNLISKFAEVERLKATSEYHQKKAEDELKLAVIYRTQAAELESYLNMEQYLAGKQNKLGSKKKVEIHDTHSSLNHKRKNIKKDMEESREMESRKSILAFPSTSSPSPSSPSPSSPPSPSLIHSHGNEDCRMLMKVKSKKIVYEAKKEKVIDSVTENEVETESNNNSTNDNNSNDSNGYLNAMNGKYSKLFLKSVSPLYSIHFNKNKTITSSLNGKGACLVQEDDSLSKHHLDWIKLKLSSRLDDDDDGGGGDDDSDDDVGALFDSNLPQFASRFEKDAANDCCVKIDDSPTHNSSDSVRFESDETSFVQDGEKGEAEPNENENFVQKLEEEDKAGRYPSLDNASLFQYVNRFEFEDVSCFSGRNNDSWKARVLGMGSAV